MEAYKQTIIGFIRDEAARKRKLRDDIDILKRLYEEDIRSIHEFIKLVVKTCNEQGFAKAQMHPTLVTYVPEEACARADFSVEISNRINVIRYRGKQNSTNIGGKDFVVGGPDMPFLHVRMMIEEWLMEKSFTETLN